MSVLVIEYNGTGQIRRWRYDPDEGYDPAANELVVDEHSVDHRNLATKRVDLDGDEPELVKDPDYDPRDPVETLSDRFDSIEQEHPVFRARISPGTRDEFEDARDEGDLEKQVSILYEILTGEGVE